MPVNHYVTLGRSGLRVSPLCLGAMTFGEDWGWGSSVADSETIIDRYLAVGGNFIDTWVAICSCSSKLAASV
jgi:aryl-alcohol dehydrogenase-like predicted oxidoreductase